MWAATRFPAVFLQPLGHLSIVAVSILLNNLPGIARTRLTPIRTASEITARIPIRPTKAPPLYQRLAPKVAELRRLGMPIQAVARALGVSRTVVIRAYASWKGTGSAEGGACPQS